MLEGGGAALQSGERQNGQLPGAGVTSIRRVASLGMSWTATVFATAPLSSRMMWTSPLPTSTNAFVPPAEYTCGVQVGSSPSYSVTVPCVTITRLGPGCVCQPELGTHPPQRLGSQVFCWT